jgi:hypothetical protein
VDSAKVEIDEIEKKLEQDNAERNVRENKDQ